MLYYATLRNGSPLPKDSFSNHLSLSLSRAASLPWFQCHCHKIPPLTDEDDHVQQKNQTKCPICFFYATIYSLQFPSVYSAAQGHKIPTVSQQAAPYCLYHNWVRCSARKKTGRQIRMERARGLRHAWPSIKCLPAYSSGKLGGVQWFLVSHSCEESSPQHTLSQSPSTLSLSLTHTHTHSLSLSGVSLTYTHTALSLSLTHTHTHTHAGQASQERVQSFTQKLKCTPTRPNCHKTALYIPGSFLFTKHVTNQK